MIEAGTPNVQDQPQLHLRYTALVTSISLNFIFFIAYACLPGAVYAAAARIVLLLYLLTGVYPPSSSK